ncbi:MAG: glycosyltransferase [Candidatus Eisenbacteria bacterium]|uniref:Glycosyltransferase n=1 Tax=Eiseniibacteriota bacterium TaxID=2212470 RepID=A0A9D6QJE4_UNCEI|nr:glycosyltransferase [Candidatus Eisenbacteria bacterium]MBI3539091.1 glycosyltransferase [Candidatus Eisenbacteria bacterium]
MALRSLEGLARRLRGHRVVMVNSTATGGGVAEILHRLVRLMNELGVPTTWEVMPGDARFYAITKTIHNTLHGWPGTLSASDHEYFHEVNRRAAAALALDGDLVLIHDPQPAGLVLHRREPGQHWVWRCHIDLSSAEPDVWSFLAPIVGRYDAAVFSHISFVPSLDVPAYLVPPSIDPLSEKNRELSDDEMEGLLAPLGLPARRPWVTQVSRFDRIKDPVGVIEAFLVMRRREDAHLVLAGGSADDDPEGAEVLAEVRAKAGSRSDITIALLPPDAHLTINALQRRSSVVVQKSLREGFALTISEALWKRRAVAASAVGGIPLQVLHDRTGLLVRSVPGCAAAMTRLLRSPDLRRRLGIEGREHVRHNFLHPREARDYLAIFARLVSAAESRAA